MKVKLNKNRLQGFILGVLITAVLFTAVYLSFHRMTIQTLPVHYSTISMS